MIDENNTSKTDSEQQNEAEQTATVTAIVHQPGPTEEEAYERFEGVSRADTEFGHANKVTLEYPNGEEKVIEGVGVILAGFE